MMAEQDPTNLRLYLGYGAYASVTQPQNDEEQGMGSAFELMVRLRA